MLYRKRGWANTDRHVLGVARAMGEQWVACSVGYFLCHTQTALGGALGRRL